MNIFLKKFLSTTLAIALACAPLGCASQSSFRNPTPETIGLWVHYGDPVTVVKKSGEEEHFTAWVITATEVGSGRNTPIKYVDMREILKRPIHHESTPIDSQDFQDTVRVVLVTPFYIAVAIAAGIARCGGGR